MDTPKRMARFPLRAHALAAVSAHADTGALRTSAGSARGALPSWWLIVTPRGHTGYAQAKSMLFLTSGYTQSVAGGHRSQRPCLVCTTCSQGLSARPARKKPRGLRGHQLTARVVQMLSAARSSTSRTVVRACLLELRAVPPAGHCCRRPLPSDLRAHPAARGLALRRRARRSCPRECHAMSRHGHREGHPHLLALRAPPATLHRCGGRPRSPW